MIEISDEMYAALAQKLKKAIGQADYFSGAIELETSDLCARLIATLIICRRTESSPEKTQKPIQNVIPVWWELKTTTDDGLQINDFSFSEIKPLLIDAL